MEIYRQFEVSASHKLNLPYDSKCKNLHGHNYKVEVWIESDLNEQGMVLDFTHLKEIVMELDHTNLNDRIEQPTCENMITYYTEKISKLLKSGKVRVRVWETSNTYAEGSYEIE